MVTTETPRTGSGELNNRISSGLNNCPYLESFKYDAAKLQWSTSTRSQARRHQQDHITHSTSHTNFKWVLRMSAPSLMDDSFWESQYFSFLEMHHHSDSSLFSLVSAQSTRSLTERRITHIVSVCTEPIPAEHPQSGIRHMRVPVQDTHHEDILIWMPSVCRFVDEALSAGGVVLIHGVHGLSRGATIMAAYGEPRRLSTRSLWFTHSLLLRQLCGPDASVPPKPWT